MLSDNVPPFLKIGSYNNSKITCIFRSSMLAIIIACFKRNNLIFYKEINIVGFVNNKSTLRETLTRLFLRIFNFSYRIKLYLNMES